MLFALAKAAMARGTKTTLREDDDERADSKEGTRPATTEAVVHGRSGSPVTFRRSVLPDRPIGFRPIGNARAYLESYGTK